MIEYTPVQEASNMFSAILFCVLFLGGVSGLLTWYASGKLIDYLDGKKKEKPLVYHNFSATTKCPKCEWPIDDNGRCLCK